MKLTRMPVFPNWFPYNDMVLDGRMKVDRYEGVKTRNWEWDYRGPILFYNSLRTAKPAVEAYKYADNPSNHKVIIGAGKLVEVRLLTKNEALQMVCNFNNLSVPEVKKIVSRGVPYGVRGGRITAWSLYNFYIYGNYVAPFEIGFFFKNLARFNEPNPFNWPPGPIKPIFTKVTAGSKLEKQLKQAGF